MPLLEMRGAVFAPRSRLVAGPVTLSVMEGERFAYACESGQAAQALAMMACGLLAPTRGSIYVAAFDPRIQPVQVKRICGYVPYEPLRGFASLEEYASYRAALWGLSRASAVVRARAVYEKLSGMHEAFAVPLAGALMTQPLLLVLDRPQPAYAQQIARATRRCTVFSTHASESDASAFAPETVLV